GVVADLVAIRTELPIGGDVDHDDAGVQRLQHVIPEAHLLDRPRAEVLHEHVGNPDQLAQGRLGFLLAQVHAQALLAAVVLDPVRALLADPGRVVAGFLATEALDLDDLGPQAGQHLGATGPGLMAAQVDHADTVQRSFTIRHRVTPSPRSRRYSIVRTFGATAMSISVSVITSRGVNPGATSSRTKRL